MSLLYIDIETSPMVVETWTAYEANALRILQHSQILGASWAWDDGPLKTAYQNPAGDGKPNEDDERSVCQTLWGLLDAAEIVVAHNGDKFDVKKINNRLLRHGLGKPSPFRTIDTLKEARKTFNLPKNNLGEIGEYLGLGTKAATGGYALWAGCMDGDLRAWRKMARYNKRDTELLRDVYKALREWMPRHPHIGGAGCPVCGSENRQSRGTRVMNSGITYHQFQCTSCRSYYRTPKLLRSPTNRP